MRRWIILNFKTIVLQMKLLRWIYGTGMNDVLAHEINKCSLCSNTYAKEKYGWIPEIDMEEGLRRVIENECELLSRWGK